MAIAAALIVLIAVGAMVASSQNSGEPSIKMYELHPYLVARPDIIDITGPSPVFHEADIAAGNGPFGSSESIFCMVRGPKGGANVPANFKGILRAEPTLRRVDVTPVTGDRLAQMDAAIPRIGQPPVPAPPTQTTSGSPEAAGPSGGT